ncbi:hypothetical protein RJ640_009599 [Escallonia rubra]|uniref:UBN2_2 domain-containing protein n=1 Tax=Escallonia rubra TaxID=112253 RepID=A0AA88UJ23_9ASTE|nr:hypothetical protein RJ640_009599 [Escallonia rubra]
MYLAHIEEQFQGSSKAHATTLITKMVTLKYSGSGGVRAHILRMNDMASQLKSLDIEISEGFLVYFIMTSLPTQFGPFKINYNMQKEMWKMNELISMCVQEEERLKSEKLDSAHDHVSIPAIQKVSAPLPHIEDNDAPETPDLIMTPGLWIHVTSVLSIQTTKSSTEGHPFGRHLQNEEEEENKDQQKGKSTKRWIDEKEKYEEREGIPNTTTIISSRHMAKDDCNK